jgi:hypothetical protein
MRIALTVTRFASVCRMIIDISLKKIKNLQRSVYKFNQLCLNMAFGAALAGNIDWPCLHNESYFWVR